MDSIKVFSPGSITNLSCGYDILGLCLQNRGDEITVSKTNKKGIIIKSIEGHVLTKDINKNVAGIAAQALLKNININYGFEIEIKKGIKPGSGIGSSAASSAGTVYAINQLLDSPFSHLDLIKYSMEGERFVSGSYHADNVAPIILGGITLVRSIDAIDVIKLPSPKSLEVIIVRPNIEIKTSDSRKVVKKKIKIEKMVQQSANLGSFISSLYTEDFDLMSKSVVDEIIEPDRSMLIPEFDKIKKISIDSGAIAVGISGSGPSIFSLSNNTSLSNKILDNITNHYDKLRIDYDGFISKINTAGIKILETK
ncbi:MAG: homoserine kinase [Cryomorphaceae bacterium]|jgi:homoserine kinase|nr:homoserine kinase [Cryomorphaceae bacterium]MBT4813914.1 homoserine kinase [Cryomorphaceae bacterium]MBT5417127.1 homoserine kinase [Cryomorphaceae bacterium]MBT6224638.1 homoserine kinase [Cryomorphaceae bacterium]